jgi:hypothetical protein
VELKERKKEYKGNRKEKDPFYDYYHRAGQWFSLAM